jgi:hypothetical protein
MKTKYMNLLFLALHVIFVGGLSYYIFNKVVVEGLESNLSDLSVSFCKKFEGNSSELETACNGLTSENCKNSNCCVWTNGSKCLAGSATGPTYKTDSDGKNLEVDNYYYMNKCYGSGCKK